MIEHLRGRDRKLEPLGWTGRDAEWIALVGLHSGVFTRAQFCDYFDTDQQHASPIRQAHWWSAERRSRVSGRDLERRRNDVPDIEQRDLPGAGSREHPPPAKGRQAGCHAAAFVAGFCAGASGYELAPRRAGEGRVF